MSPKNTWILTAACPDRNGIVAAVSGFLAQHDCSILEAEHHAEVPSERFFMRTVFCPPQGAGRAELGDAFGLVAKRFGMSWRLQDAARKQRLVVMVSKAGHCLNDLLYRWRTGELNVEIAAIVSNHNSLAEQASWHDIPFHHLPITKDTKPEQEAEVMKIVEDVGADLVVLARYMQILSPKLCDALHGRCINIHHSFLPGFKGAKPYQQAWDRGVKIIGATAHYVTSDLDEGPIIEQSVERADHRATPRELASRGRDIERVVLARAVKAHLEHRVMVDGLRTIVFR